MRKPRPADDPQTLGKSTQTVEVKVLSGARSQNRLSGKREHSKPGPYLLSIRIVIDVCDSFLYPQRMPPRTSKPVLSRLIRTVETKASGRKVKMSARDHTRGMKVSCTKENAIEAVACTNDKFGLKK